VLSFGSTVERYGVFSMNGYGSAPNKIKFALTYEREETAFSPLMRDE
jgi:hypothetical protein